MNKILILKLLIICSLPLYAQTSPEQVVENYVNLLNEWQRSPDNTDKQKKVLASFQTAGDGCGMKDEIVEKYYERKSNCIPDEYMRILYDEGSKKHIKVEIVGKLKNNSDNEGTIITAVLAYSGGISLTTASDFWIVDNKITGIVSNEREITKIRKKNSNESVPVKRTESEQKIVVQASDNEDISNAITLPELSEKETEMTITEGDKYAIKVIYGNHVGQNHNDSLASEYYRKAIWKGGSVLAALKFGFYQLYNSRYVNPELSFFKAIENYHKYPQRNAYYHKEIDNDYLISFAYLGLAICYYYKIPPYGKEAKKFKLSEEDTEKLREIGITHNVVVNLLEKAASYGNEDAMIKLGVIDYNNGYIERAMSLFQKVCQSETTILPCCIADAKCLLGICYYKQKDKETALKYFKEAEETGFTQSCSFHPNSGCEGEFAERATSIINNWHRQHFVRELLNIPLRIYMCRYFGIFTAIKLK